MFETHGQPLGPVDPLIRAIDERNSMALLNLIQDRDFTVLGYPKGDGLDPETATEQQFDEQLQWEADQLDEMAEDDDLEAMTVECDGRTALLAFTTEQYVDSYIEKLTVGWHRLVGVPVFDISGETLLAVVPSDCDVLLNAGSDEERWIDSTLLNRQG